MRIKTQFTMTMLLFGIILVVIAASAIITHLKIQEATRQESLAASIAQGANELGYLSNDYLIYRESQQFRRWQSRFASFSNLVASLLVDKPEQQVLVRNIRANERRLKQVFDSVASTLGGSPSTPTMALDLAFLQVSWSRMAVQSQALVSDASRLSRLLDQQVDQLTQIRAMLMYVMVGLFGIFLLASYRLTYSRILKSLATLRAGTAVIGSGNLDFVVAEKKNDEIGDLSHAFNRMTASLKQVTASKADLEREVTQRKQAEEELNKQREWLRVTLSSIGDAVIAADTDGRVTFLNPVAVMLTGWRLEEALGQPIQSVFRIVNEKTQQPAEDLVARVLSEKRAVALANDTALVTKDGRKVPIEDSAAPIKDLTDNVRGAVLVFHDVTAKRRAQAALRESEERFRAIFESSSDCILVWDRQYNYLYANHAAIDHVGTTRDKVIGKNIRDGLGHLPDFMHLWMGRVDRAFATGESFRVEDAVPVGDRLVHSESQVSPIRDAAGRVFAVGVVYRDVTKRKQAEETLRESEERLKRAQEISHLGSWELDVLGNRLTWSDEVYRIFGLQPQEFGATYEAFLEAVYPDDRAAVDAAYSSSVREGRASYEVEHRVVRKSTGETRTVHERCEHIRDASGRIIRSVGMVHDITERKRAEEALRQRTLELQQLTETLERRVQERTEELAEANKALRQLSIRLLSAQEEERKRVAGELHDTIGACLSGIKFKVEDTLQRIGNKADVETKSLKTIVPVIQEAVEECRRIQLDLRPSMLDDLGLLPTLSWLSRRFKTIYSRIHVDQKVMINESDVPDSLKIVIYRVIQEAMNNCAKHSGANRIYLSLQKIGGNIELVLEDNGKGFDLGRVFNTESMKRGFGLTSMRERTELSGGSFDMESLTGKGTIIRARWPISLMIAD